MLTYNKKQWNKAIYAQPARDPEKRKYSTCTRIIRASVAVLGQDNDRREENDDFGKHIVFSALLSSELKRSSVREYEYHL